MSRSGGSMSTLPEINYARTWPRDEVAEPAAAPRIIVSSRDGKTAPPGEEVPSRSVGAFARYAAKCGYVTRTTYAKAVHVVKGGAEEVQESLVVRFAPDADLLERGALTGWACWRRRDRGKRSWDFDGARYGVTMCLLGELKEWMGQRD